MGTGGMVLMGPAQPLKHVIDELSLELGLISIRKHAVVRLQDAQRRFDSDIYIYIYGPCLVNTFAILLLIYILISPADCLSPCLISQQQSWSWSACRSVKCGDFFQFFSSVQFRCPILLLFFLTKFPHGCVSNLGKSCCNRTDNDWRRVALWPTAANDSISTVKISCDVMICPGSHNKVASQN